MAKGLRSSVKQQNKSKLRATVFGPAADSRTERLSAKLQELASRPKEANMEDADFNIIEKSEENNNEEKEMDVDEGDGAHRHLIAKRAARKSRNAGYTRIGKIGIRSHSSRTLEKFAE